MLLSAQEQLEAMRRMKADEEWISGYAPRVSSFYFQERSAGSPYDVGRIVVHKGDLHQIMGQAYVMKKGSPYASSSSGDRCYFLKRLGGEELIGHIWRSDLTTLNEMQMLALAALTDEEIKRAGGVPILGLLVENDEEPKLAEQMVASCAGRCKDWIRGPVRHVGDPEFTEADVKGFEDFVWDFGWWQNGNQVGSTFWWCAAEPCVHPDDYCTYTRQWQGKGLDPLWHTYTANERKGIKPYLSRFWERALPVVGQPEG